MTTKRLCVRDDAGAETCVTKAQLDTLLSGGGTGSVSSGGGNSSSSSSSSIDDTTTSTTTTSAGGDSSPSGGGVSSSIPDTAAPVITINGNNPATINVGDAYADLGATVSDNVDTNLGIYTYVDGVQMSSVQIDTSIAGDHTIEYRATDNASNASTASRTVHVVSPVTTTPVDTSTSTPSTTADTGTSTSTTTTATISLNTQSDLTGQADTTTSTTTTTTSTTP